MGNLPKFRFSTLVCIKAQFMCWISLFTIHTIHCVLIYINVITISTRHTVNCQPSVYTVSTFQRLLLIILLNNTKQFGELTNQLRAIGYWFDRISTTLLCVKKIAISPLLSKQSKFHNVDLSSLKLTPGTSSREISFVSIRSKLHLPKKKLSLMCKLSIPKCFF